MIHHGASGVRDISGGCNDSPPGPGSQECTTRCRKEAANPYQSTTAPKISSRATSIASIGVGTATDKNHKRNQDSRSPPTLASRRSRSCSESANDRRLAPYSDSNISDLIRLATATLCFASANKAH